MENEAIPQSDAQTICPTDARSARGEGALHGSAEDAVERGRTDAPERDPARASKREAWTRTFRNDDGEKEMELVIDGAFTLADEEWMLERILAGFRADWDKFPVYRGHSRQEGWDKERLVGLERHLSPESPSWTVRYNRSKATITSSDWLCTLFAAEQPLEPEHLAISFMYLGTSDIDSDIASNDCFADPAVSSLSVPMRELLACSERCIREGVPLFVTFTHDRHRWTKEGGHKTAKRKEEDRNYRSDEDEEGDDASESARSGSDFVSDRESSESDAEERGRSIADGSPRIVEATHARLRSEPRAD